MNFPIFQPGGENKELSEYFREKKLVNVLEPERRLGLEFAPDGKLVLGAFVGQVWLEAPKLVLQVNRTRGNENQDVDCFQMLCVCLEDQMVARHLPDKSLFFWEDEPEMEAQPGDELHLLVITQFLRELYDLCRRTLRRSFIRVEENLQARCKGRLLVHPNLRHNLARGRADRLYCQFQVHSLDSPLNQILRAALEQSLRYLRRLGLRENLCLWHWGNFALASLSGVTLRRIHPGDFHGLHLTGLLKAYQQPLASAKKILRILGSDPTGELTEDVFLPPYALKMFEIFERYCEVLLRRKFKTLWAGYDDGKNNFPGNIKVRPDFIGPAYDKKGKIHPEAFGIYDAKFKNNWKPRALCNKEKEGNCRGDVEQMLTYSRHQLNREVRDPYPDGLYGLYVLVPEFKTPPLNSPDLSEPQSFSSDFIKDLANNGKNLDLPFYIIKIPVPLK